MSDRKRTTYTKEFKREAVGYSIAEASRNLGITQHAQSLENRTLKERRTCFSLQRSYSQEQAELSRLV